MATGNPSRVPLARWSWRILATLAVAGAAVVTIRDATITGDVSAPARGTAVFSGQFEQGVPVYRLPSITVSAIRGTEPGLARTQADTRVASPYGEAACPTVARTADDSRATAC
jgi:hypothetical protein